MSARDEMLSRSDRGRGTNEPTLLRRLAETLLNAALRLAPPETRDWGQAMLSELRHVNLDMAQEIMIHIQVLHHLLIGSNAAGFGNRFAILHHTSEVKLQRFFHVGHDLFDRFSDRWSRS